MKRLKDNIYTAILHAAREEFFAKGYKDASMRTIAKNSNVGLSNIYNYFKGKDELYLTLVKPARDEIYAFITEQHTEQNMEFEFMSTAHYQEKAIESYILLIDKYREELRLLLFHSEGSSLKNFRDLFTDHLTTVSHSYMEVVKKRYPATKPVSDFFMHALCSWMVSILGEIIAHDISKHKIREFFREYFKFEIAGWRDLIGL